MKVFLADCLLVLFLLIHHDNKVHWYNLVFKEMMMMTMMILILMFILGCLLLAEWKYCINKQVPGHESEILFETLLACPLNSWFFPPECISLLVTRVISGTTWTLPPSSAN